MNQCLNCKKPVKNKFCSVSCQNQHQNTERANKLYGHITEFKVNCQACNNEFIVKERAKLYPRKSVYFCNRSCANKRIHSNETKNKIRKSLTKTDKNQSFTKSCPSCNSILTYKSQRHLRRSLRLNQVCVSCRVKNSKISGQYKRMGLKSIDSQQRRSKNEIYFAELCKNYFGNVLTNEQIFNGWDADVILPEQKIAVLWNGVWHYKQIRKNNSLEQIQNRDKIKLQEIKRSGFVPYIIKDMGSFDTLFVEKKFNEFVKLVAEAGLEPARHNGGTL